MVCALTAAMMPFTQTASYAWRVPKTLQAYVAATANPGTSVLGPRLVQETLPFAATHLGVTWRGEGPAPRVRTSSDGKTWSEWQRPLESEDMFDRTTGTHFSELMAGREARWARIAPGEGSNASSLSLAVINTRDGPLRTLRVVRAALAATPQPQVLSRRQWGADESIRRGQPTFSPVQKIFVHHTVTPDDADPASTIRAIYAYHVGVRGWEDIGYNFLIDSRGNIYEGRYSGPGRAPGEDSGGRGVVGAHTDEHNHGSSGIALLANTDKTAPGPAAVDSLVDLVAWKADRHGIDPAGASAVAGHRDAGSASTECPGEHLYSLLPSIRQRAKEIVEASRRGSGGPVGNLIRPILDGPAPGPGDSVSGILEGIGL